MGTITKRGELWQGSAQGLPGSVTHVLPQEDAEKWVRDLSTRPTRAVWWIGGRRRRTRCAILFRYQAEVTPAKKSANIETVKIDVILRRRGLAQAEDVGRHEQCGGGMARSKAQAGQRGDRQS